MTLKNLSIAVVILAALAGVAAFLNRPTPPPETDPRVGQELLAAATANAAQSITLTHGENTVTVTRDTATDGWRVSSYHDLPANLTKLRSFVQSLTAAKIQRVVTRNPERAARLELDQAHLALTPTSGDMWSINLGKNAERGGRYLRFEDGDTSPVYLTDFNGYLDTAGKNWAETKLVAAGRDDIAAVTLTFADEEPLTLTRESATGDWTATPLPAGKQVKAGAIATLLSTASGLRFTEVTTPDDPDVADAAAHSRTFTFKTFAGDELTITLGRRPEEKVLKDPEPANPVAAATEMIAEAQDSPAPESAEEVVADLTETIPAGPTIARIAGPTALAPLAEFNATLAFEVSDYSFTSLPANRDALLEDAPAPAAVAAP